MKYDAIIVGAGPAGLIGARTLASKGFKVIILEKERRLGVKPCGEACSTSTLEDSLVDPQGDFVVQKIKRALIYAPNKKSVPIEGEAGVGCILNKALFLQHLASKAIEAGTDILMGNQVVSLERKEGLVKVKTKEIELEAKLILGADGFTSTVAKSFGLEKTGNREIIPCIQYLMVNCTLKDEQTVEFYLGREVAPLGYAWVFPKGEGKANVGIGVRGNPSKPYLEKFIEGNSDMFSRAKAIGVEGAPVTIGGMLEQIVDDNVMLVGEAAGQVIPLTGAGIHSGVVGAKMAAQIAIEALEKDNLSKDKLMDYSKNYNKHWGKRILDSLKTLRMLEQLNDHELNTLADLLDSNDILDLANGLDVVRVARMFLKHPIFGLKIARMLMRS